MRRGIDGNISFILNLINKDHNKEIFSLSNVMIV